MKDCDERIEFTNNYWNYYRILEQDCVKLRRYISFRKSNFRTCSDEIIKQLISVSSEFDNVCKEIIRTDKKKPNIVDYGKWFFGSDKPSIKNEVVILRRSNIRLKPFNSWGETKKDVMLWWDAYNSVKHNRSEDYQKGNLENLLNAIAALYYMERYQYRYIAEKNSEEGQIIFDVPPDRSELFYLENFKTRTTSFGNGLYCKS